MRKYEISGGDDGAYGPVFGPILAEEIAEIEHAAGGTLLLLPVVDELIYQGDKLELLALAPRYEGETIESLRAGECIVGISRILGTGAQVPPAAVTAANSEYWAIGSCRPWNDEWQEVRDRS